MARFPDGPAFGLSAHASDEDTETQDNTAVPEIGGAGALEIARADAEYLVRTKGLRDSLAAESDPNSLPEKYEPLFRMVHEDSAALITDPRQRELWTHRRAADLDGQILAASDLGLRLKRDRELADVTAHLDAIRNAALGTDDQKQRYEFIQTANSLIGGLQQAGRIDDADAKARQKAWAEDFSLAVFSKLPAAEQIRWLEGEPQDREAEKGELIDFVPQEKRESLLQSARRSLRDEDLAAQSAAALERNAIERRTRDDLVSILQHGKGVDGLQSDDLRAGLSPEALRQWQERREDFHTIRRHTEDLYALTDQELEARLRSLAPDDPLSDPSRIAMFHAVGKQIEDLRQLRLIDPAKSVDEDPAVRAASVAEGQADNPQARRELYAARLAAQERAGIDRDVQSPITKEEASALIAPLQIAKSDEKAEALARVAATFEAEFGADADRALDFALRLEEAGSAAEPDQAGASENYLAGSPSGSPLLTRMISIDGEHGVRVNTDPVARWDEIMSLAQAGSDDAAGDPIQVGFRGRKPPRKPGRNDEGGDPLPPWLPLLDFLPWRRRETRPDAQTPPPAERREPVVSEADAQELRRRVAAKAPQAEIEALPVIRDAIANMRAIPPTATVEQISDPAFTAAREFEFKGERFVGYDSAASRLAKHAREYSTDGPVRNEGIATIVIGPPAAGKSTFSEQVARRRFAAIVDIDDARPMMREYQGGVGSSAVHLESVELAQRALDQLAADRSNVVLPKIGSRIAQIQDLIKDLRARGYRVDLLHVDVPSDEAFRRNAIRYLEKDRLVPPNIYENVSSRTRNTYYLLKERGVLHDWAEIDNSGPIGADRVTDGNGELVRILRK